MSKCLVVYFSASGITREVSKRLAEKMEASLFEIEPQQSYSRVDLNWNDSESRSSLEMKDPNSRPAIKNQVQNMDQYDVIFIGSQFGGIESHLLLIPLWKAMISAARRSCHLRHLEEAVWEILHRIYRS